MRKLIYSFFICFSLTTSASENGLRAYLVDLKKVDEVVGSNDDAALAEVLSARTAAVDWVSESGRENTAVEITTAFGAADQTPTVSGFALWRMVDAVSTHSYPMVGMPSLDLVDLAAYFEQADVPKLAALFTAIGYGDSGTVTQKLSINDIYVLTLYAPSKEELQLALDDMDKAVKVGKQLMSMKEPAKKHLIALRTKEMLSYCEDYECIPEEKRQQEDLSDIERSAMDNAYTYEQAMDEFLINARELKKWMKTALKSDDRLVFVYHEI